MGQVVRNVMYRWRGFRVKLYLNMHGCKVGKGLKCITMPQFRIIPKKNITIGNNVLFGEQIVIEVSENGKLEIGNNANFTRNITLAVNAKVVIGNNCLFGENVSIRDTNHKTDKDKLILKQGFDSEAISIDEDVWIGANSVVLMGSNIPKGVVVGANSLVVKKSSLESFGIYGGSPVKFLKSRD